MADRDRRRWVLPHVSHQQLFGDTMSEGELIANLGSLSVFDCLWVTSQLSCVVESGPLTIERQLEALRRMNLSDSVDAELANVLSPDGIVALFFPQQLTHL